MQSAGNLVLNVGDIAGDNTINIAEKAAGFAIAGDTGSEGGVAVTVTVGTAELTATSADADPATWSVSVPADASYITGTSVDVEVNASKTGFTSPAAVERALAVDLIAPTAPAYTAPSSLRVGAAITDMSPTGGSDVEEYSATGLPSGLSIDSSTGAIGGTPDSADADTATATVTATDTAGNTATVDIAFPAVDKGDQTLTGFQYSASSVTFGSAAPTVTAPSGVLTTLSYTATPATACTVDAGTGALTLVGPGSCAVTATAASTDDYNEATATFTVTVQSAGNLVLNVGDIAGDNTINIAEKAAGFAIAGNTGSEGGVAVTVTVGTAELTATSADADPATWSVSVPADASYITGTSVDVEVNASKTGFTSPAAVERPLTVDLVAPTVPAYTAPGTLKVGAAIADMSPTGGSDVEEYSATGLPSGLSIDSSTGAIGGTPDSADADTATATVTATDTAGNTATVDIAFPAVEKGDQTLTGFQYSASSVTFGSAAPTVTAPSGVLTTLSYTATPATACTVDSSTGALTIIGVGGCEITATAASTDDYNEATATFTVTIQPTGTLVLNVGAIAGDDTINIAEKAAGFAIAGDTGSEGGVSVAVTVGTTELTATSADADPATWSVDVPADASYITGTSVDVEVNAAKTGYTSPAAVERALAVDLVAPTAPTYTAPASLKVGEPIAAIDPTGGSDVEEYSATGLPSGLSIDAGAGAIGGTPDTADAGTATATVTATDTAGNTATVDIAFPAVEKGDQTLTGFQYSASSVLFGSSAPTVTAPSGAVAALSYTATPATVCTVDSSTGALTIVGVGSCEVAAAAASTDDYNEATVTYTVTILSTGTLVLNVGAIAGDDTINIAEKAAGFAIAGDTGSEGGVTITVTVGTTELTATSADADPATWSVSVPAAASYITGTGVDVEVNASKTGFTSPAAVERALAVDLIAPTAPAYTAPALLQVGVTIAPLSPAGGSIIDEYSATGLPSGLSIDSSTGTIGGTPDSADAGTASATVTASDTAGNTATVSISFPAVEKGDQTLTGFQYSASSVNLGSAAPTVTAPSGAQTTLSYSAAPATVCTVNAFSGALTLVGEGSCLITATAASTDDYNAATATYTVTVQGGNTLVTLTVSDERVYEYEGTTSVTVTGTLNNAPRNSATSVAVTVGAPGDAAVEGADYATVADFTLTIDASLISGTATFFLTPADDAVDEAHETLTVAGTTAAAGLSVAATTITIGDDDDRGVDVSPTSLTLSEGGSAAYTVVLTSEPTGDVTVTPAVTGSSGVTLNAASLTFTPSNWHSARTLTVSGAQDADPLDDTATLEHTVSGADYGDNGVTARDVPVTVSDDDTASTGIALTVSDEAIGEDAGATAVTVIGTLNDAPLTADTAVTVTVGAPGDAAVEGADYATVADLTLTIPAGEVSATADFSLTPTDDDVDEADETLAVAGTTDAAGLTVTGTAIAIADDDERGVNVTPASLFASEGGSSTYAVVLTSEPTGPVTVTPSVDGSADVTLDVSSLTFTASNWDTARTVTVSAAEDTDDADDTAMIEHGVSGADYGDNGVTADPVAVTVGDDETASTEITLSVSPQHTDEAAGAASVTVTGTLSNAPRDADTAVTVSVGASGDAAVEGADYATVDDLTLTIDAGDTTGSATFTLTPTDDEVDEGDETLTVAGATSAAGLTVTPTTVAIHEDDERGVRVSPALLTVPEGGSSTYTAVLTSQPTDTVTVTPSVTPSVTGESDVTLGPPSLIFTAQDWETAQTVTVFAAGDTDAEDDEATVEHAVAGGDYGSAIVGDVSVTVNDAALNNNVPVFPAALARALEVAENSAADTAIGAPLAATDADGDTLVYALEGLDADSFAIDPDSGQLKTLAALDHESRIGHSLTVVADDGHGGRAGVPVTVTVTDVDEQPGAPASPLVLAAPGSTDSLRLRWSAPDENGGPAITGYAVQYRQGEGGDWRDHRHTGTDTRAAIAGLAAATDYQARVRALNGETPGEWSEPGDGNTGNADNGAPVFDSGLPAELTVDENTPAGADLGAPFTATDADADTLTYLLDGADRHAFAIDPDSGQLSTLAALDHESRASYSVTVRADDGHGGADGIALTVGVADIDEQAATPGAPAVLAMTGSTTGLEVNWSAPDTGGGPALVGYAVQYRENDPSDPGPWIDHRHRGADTHAAIDYLDASTSYQARVRALNGEIAGEWSEPGAGSTGDTANTPPVFDDGLPAGVRVDENTAAGIDLGAPFAATDPDGDTLTYLLEGTGRHAFAIDAESGQLSTAAALDHEAKAAYSVRVRVSDGRGGADAMRVRVGIVDLPEMAPPLPAPSVLANADSTASLDLRWTAPGRNGGPVIAGYQVQYRAGTDGPWSDHAHKGADTRATVAELVAATDYEARVRALNGEIPGDWSEPGAGNTGTADNDAPIFDSGLPAAVTVNENTGADSDIGAPFTATDPDGDTLTWLLDGAGSHAFAIDADSGQLRTRAALDHEARASYLLSVRVSDGAGGADTTEVTVNVADRDEKAAQPSPPWVLSTVDDAASLDVRWTAPAANGGPAIAGYDVQYREGTDGAWMDHEHEGAATRAAIADLVAATEYQARARALNGETPGDWSAPGAGNTARPGNSAPAFPDDTATRSIAENSEAGDPVGAPVTAADTDRDRLTYFLAGTDADAFGIDAQTGQIRTAAALDYEAQPSYSVTVVANDGNGGADTIDVSIELIDLQEEQADLGPAAPTGVTLGRVLSLDAANVVQSRIALGWDAPASDEMSPDEMSWFEFRLGRYPESGNGLAPPAFQCAGNRPFEADGWRRIPDSGPGGANARSYRFDAQTLGCYVLPDTFELRAQVRAVSGATEGVSTKASAPSTEARMQDEAPRVAGAWLDAEDVNRIETGDDLVFVVAFTEPVRVVAATESPSLAIELGDDTRQAVFEAAAKPPAFRNYGSGNIGSRLRFRYRVQDGDALDGGIVVPADAISIAGAAAIVDATGPGGHAAVLRNPRTTIAEGTTVIAASAQASLTGSFEPDTVPQAHDGETAFTVQVAFDETNSTDGAAADDQSTESDGDGSGQTGGSGQTDGQESDLGGLTLSASSFLVTGGRVTDVSPLEEGQNRRWVVGVEPDARADVSISLGPTFDCTDEGAVCTDNGRKLANNIHAVVKGPPRLSVSDARVTEAVDATMDFAVTLSRAAAETVTVDYATSDVTATAGEDYTQTAGTLTFEAGETSRTVAVAVLDDAHDDDGETFTLTLSNPSGGNVYLAEETATGTIENSDPMPKAWIARFGRTVSDHVIDAIQARLRDGPRETQTHLTLGGLRMNSFLGRRDTGAAQRPAGTHGLEGGSAGGFAGGYSVDGTRASDGQWGGVRPFATASYPGGGLAGGGLADGNGPGTVVRGAGGYARELPNLREILKGSSFFYSSADQARDADAPDAGGFRDWSAWGRMAETRFRGDDGPLSLDGEVTTGTLGVDARWNRWMTGVVLARSEGLGEYAHNTASGGSVTSTLTSLHPFAQYLFNERTSVWGTIGYGLGDLSLTPAGAPASVDTDLRMSMAALGGRGVLSMRTGGSGSFELAMRSDAMLTATESGASENLLSATGATSRVRVILEGRGSLPLGTGGVLTPTLEAGLRYDGGDAETGAGLEVGAGLGYSSGRLTVQLDARGLVAHEDAGYEEWGLSGSIAYRAREDGKGLSVNLGSRSGATASGVQSLWTRQNASGLARGGAAMHAARRVQAELGYGLDGPRGRALWIPYLGAEAGEGASGALRFGVKLTSGPNAGAELEIRTTGIGVPRESDSRAPQGGTNAALRLNWALHW